MPMKKKKKSSKKRAKRVVKKAAKKVVRKAVKRKVTKKKVVKKKKALSPVKKIKEKVIGIVTHYFPQVRAAVIKLKAPLAVGDTIKIKGHTTDFKEKVNSIQLDLVPIQAGKKGQEIGLLVKSRVRIGDSVYRI